MKARFSSMMLICVCMISAGLMIGCGPGEPPGDEPAPAPAEGDSAHDGEIDPHDVPITEEQEAQLKVETAKFADAVAKVKELRDVIEQETKDGIPENPFEAHQALDKLDIVLPWLPGTARDSDVAKENWEQVNTAATSLRELFESIHQNIDDGKDPGFAAIKADIDAKIAELSAAQ